MLRVFLVAATLAGALSTAQAGSILVALEQAAEVPLRAFELPAAPNGVVEFTVCGGCALRSAAISGNTSYLIDHRAATFEAFAAAVAAARATPESADHSLVGLYFDAATQHAVRIALISPFPSR